MSKRVDTVCEPRNTCPLCAHPSRTVKRYASGDLKRCSACKIVFLDTNDTLSAADQFTPYNASYFQTHINYFGPEDDLAEHVRRRRPMVELVERFCQPPGRILDVGCAGGLFLACARDNGWETWGFDISLWACQFAQDKLCLSPILCGLSLADVDLPQNYFDVVTMWHVLEHIPKPISELQAIGNLLKSNGWLIIQVPNFASLEARLHKEQWRGLDLPYHLFHFTPHTLEQVARKAGFRKVGSVFEMLYRPSRIFSAVGIPSNSWLYQGFARVLSGRDMTLVFRKCA